MLHFHLVERSWLAEEKEGRAVLWGELYSPKRHVQGLTPTISECDLVWKQDRCRCNEVRIRSCRVRAGPDPGGDATSRSAETGVMCLPAKGHQALSAATRSWDRGTGFSLRTPPRNQGCWHLTFRLLASRTLRGNTQIMVFCCNSPENNHRQSLPEGCLLL